MDTTPRADEESPTSGNPLALIPNVAAVGVILLATAVLTGWWLDIPLLKTVLPGGTSMKANTAIAFLCSGMALLSLRWAAFNAIRYAMAVVTTGLSALTLAEYASGRTLGIDQLFFRDLLSPQFPGRMAPVSAAAFILVSFALCLYGRKPPFPTASQALALMATVGPAFGIVGYLYGVPILYGSIHYTAMAFHTGLGMLLLTFGILFADPDEGIARIFKADTSAGILARVAIPASILVPIMIGFIFVHPEFNFSQARFGTALTVICSSAVFAAPIWTLAFFLESRELQWSRARHQANVDGLTGVMNRRFFERSLVRAMKQSDLSALNDSVGHLAGDQVLCALAQVLKGRLRDSDIVCMFGGEEFAVIAPGVKNEEAVEAADRLRVAVEDTVYPGLGHIRMTVSAGVSTYPIHGASRGQLLAAADGALNVAKTSGRNQVVACDRMRATLTR